MRIALGQIQPGYLAPSVTLVSGKVISNPAMQAPTDMDCLPYRCGGDPYNTAARQWCSMFGRAGVLSCNSPECDPVRQYLTNCTPPIAPAVPVQAGPVPVPLALPPPVLTPANIVQPIPDITATVAPEPLPSCSLWCDLNRAIAAHPWIAAAVLAAGYLAMRKGNR